MTRELLTLGYGMSPVRFYEAEALRIHELLDGAGVPRTVAGGMPLSISQRVEEFLRMARVGRTAPTEKEDS